MEVIIICGIIFVICLIAGILLSKRSINNGSLVIQGKAENNSDDSLYQQIVGSDGHATFLMSLYNSLDDERAHILHIFKEKDTNETTIIADNGKGWKTKYAVVILNEKERWAIRNGFVFSTLDMTDDIYSYHPTKVTYTGATVGGVHTGGFNVDGAHYTKSQSKSGRCAIKFSYATDAKEFVVFKIKLNDRLLNEIRKNEAIKMYLDENDYLVLFNNNSSLSEDLSHYAANTFSSNQYAAMQAQSMAVSDKFLREEECKTIIKWLTNAIYQYPM